MRTMIGLGALSPEEAIHPNTVEDSSGQVLNGKYRYRLHLAASETPPTGAFWSLTLYDEDGFLTDTAIRKYAIGDRDALHFNADGSLDILIQHQRPHCRRQTGCRPPRRLSPRPCGSICRCGAC